MDLLTKEEIEKAGFIYEPDASKCKTRKLRLYVPAPEGIDDDYKKEIIEQICYKHVHKVWETPNPYEGDPNFLADPRVLVTGHTPNGK